MNTYYVGGIPFNGYNCLAHHGIKGQKWGQRRFQNEDGSLTLAGARRYLVNLGGRIGYGAQRAYGNAREFVTGEKSARALRKSGAAVESSKDRGRLLSNFRQAVAENNASNKRDSTAKRTANLTAQINRDLVSRNSHAVMANYHANKKYNKTLPGLMYNAKKEGSKYVQNLYRKASEKMSSVYKDAVKSASSAYNNASRQAQVAYSNISRIANDSYSKVLDFINDVSESAKKKKKKAQAAISNYGNVTVSAITSKATSAYNSIKGLLSKIFGR